MDKNNLIKELKDLVIESLELDDVNPEEIDENKSLLDDDLGLNSIDLLELTVALEKKYNIKIGNAETAQKAFESFNTLAQFIIDKLK